MATTQSDHRRLSPQLRLSVPLRSSTSAAPPSPFSFSPSYSASTPSKLRRLPSPSSSFSSLFLLLFSLRSFYSLLPFLRSAPPSFSLFPFSFLVSLLSFLLSLPFSLPYKTTLNPSIFRPLLAKSFLLSLVFLLRFHSLRYCSAAASILADFSGALAARSISGLFRRRRHRQQIVGLVALTIALVLLFAPDEACSRVSAVGFTFLAGFVGFYERAVGNGGALRRLGRKKTRLGSLAFTTVILFFPAFVSLFVGGSGGDGRSDVSVGGMVWPLINTVVFGVVLNENFGGDEKFGRNFRREFLVTFFCVFVLELVYYPRLWLPGFLVCGFFLWVSVWGLDSSSFQYVELGNVDSSGNIYALVVNPVRHILSQRKSRKIALFLLINTGYMAVEFVAGFVSNSLGLISDACHMLFDCAALAIGLYASYISGLPANSKFNYGRGRFEVLSGYANAVFLVLVGALIVLESIERILDPQEISTNSMLTVSVGGLLVNIIGLVFFHEEHHHAHGGGGSCSHLHSHSCSHSNSGSQSHSISHPNSLGDSHGGNDYCSSKDEHHHSSSNSNVQLQSISHEQSHVGNNEHSCLHSHHHHHHHHDHHSHNQSNNCDQHTHVDKHNHNLRQQKHDRHSDLQEPDHHHEMHHIGDHNHQDSSKHKHEHQNLLVGIKEEGLKMHYHIDHNMEGIFLHVLADTMGSVGVVISTLLIKYKGWLIADPACSIFISVMIIASVVPLLRNSAEILLQRIPRTDEQNLRVTRDSLMRIEGVCGVRNFHVWSSSNTEIVGTVHLHVFSEADKVLIKKRASELFHEAGFKDIIIQVECVR